MCHATSLNKWLKYGVAQPLHTYISKKKFLILPLNLLFSMQKNYNQIFHCPYSHQPASSQPNWRWIRIPSQLLMTTWADSQLDESIPTSEGWEVKNSDILRASDEPVHWVLAESPPRIPSEEVGSQLTWVPSHDLRLSISPDSQPLRRRIFYILTLTEKVCAKKGFPIFLPAVGYIFSLCLFLFWLCLIKKHRAWL